MIEVYHMKSNIWDILGLILYFIGRFIVGAIGVVLVLIVVGIAFYFLWWLLLPLMALGLGVKLIEIARG